MGIVQKPNDQKPEFIYSTINIGYDHPLQYSCSGKSHGQKTQEPGRLQSIGFQELEMTQRLNLHHYQAKMKVIYSLKCFLDENVIHTHQRARVHTFAQWNIPHITINDETLPFVQTWVKLENIILSEVNQTEKDKYDTIYLWNIKNNTNESTYKTEADSQTQKINLWLLKRKGGV